MAAARCVVFVQGLFYPCEQVVRTFERSSVLWLALKLVSCLCLSEKRRVLNSQDLFVLPGLRHSAVVDLVGLFSFGVLYGVFINVMKEIRGFRGPGVTSGISIFL